MDAPPFGSFNKEKAKNHFFFNSTRADDRETETVRRMPMLCIFHVSFARFIVVPRSVSVFYLSLGQIDDSDFPYILHMDGIKLWLLRFMLEQFSIYCFSMKFSSHKR